MVSVVFGEMVPKTRGAALSHRDGAADRRCRCCGRGALYAWFIVVLDRSSNAAALAAARAAGDAPSRAFAGGDRAAHRREPRRRAARAAGTGAAAPRAASRAARRAAADGAARSPGGDRDRDAARATCCASSRPAPTAGCRSIAARSTTSSASCTPRTSSRTSCERGRAGSLAGADQADPARARDDGRRSPARLPARAAQPPGARRRRGGARRRH